MILGLIFEKWKHNNKKSFNGVANDLMVIIMKTYVYLFQQIIEIPLLYSYESTSLNLISLLGQQISYNSETLPLKVAHAKLKSFIKYIFYGNYIWSFTFWKFKSKRWNLCHQ